MVTNLLLLVVPLLLMVIGAGVVLGVLLYAALMVGLLGLLVVLAAGWVAWRWYRLGSEDIAICETEGKTSEEGGG